MRTLFHTIRIAVLAAPALLLAACFEEGGYTNVVIPGTVFDVDSLSGPAGDTLYFDYKGSAQIVPITTNRSDWTFNVVSGGDFCSARKSGGIAVTVSENERMAPRTAEISLKCGDEARHIFVHQRDALPFFRLSPTLVDFDSIVLVDGEGVSVDVTVAANFQWSFEPETGSSEWLSFNAPEVKNLRTALEIYCYKDNADTTRTAVITFTADNDAYQSYIGAKKITITQQGAKKDE
jgi:hypothetical protein